MQFPNPFKLLIISLFLLLALLRPKTIVGKVDQTNTEFSLKYIVIDPGHGGKDPGAIGINRLQEKIVTLDIAKQLTKMLERNLGI